MQPPALASKSFYKRPLPPQCVPFNSGEGRTVFAHALAEGHLESYFLLAQHFLTQNEPAYCALGTLAMILNALEMDPHRVWKGPWRFYDQDMLDCCRPLADIAEVGLTLSEFACLARCNGLRATVVSPGPPGNDLARFRRDLKRASTGGATMALSYSRRALGQTGTGHFSPIGAYSERDDHVLVLDVARFKYPSYWIPVQLAYESMRPIDDATGQPRGYVMLDVAPSRDVGSLAGKQSLTTLTLNKSSWAVLSNSLSRLLLETPKTSTLESLFARIASHISNLPTPAVVVRPPAPPTSSSDPDSTDSPAPSRPPSPTPAASISSLPVSLLASTSSPSPDPLVALFVLALVSPRSSLAALVPPHLAPDVRDAVDAATGASAVVRDEVEFLTGQVGALGECCRAEEAAATACGCAGKKNPNGNGDGGDGGAGNEPDKRKNGCH
ncbi:hypothetical protein JCM11491_002994 [Sporobolomyces phaffii]